MAVKEVDVTEFNINLKHWLEIVGEGEEVVVTERGIPLARLERVRELTQFDQMVRDGIIRPAARPKRTTLGIERVPAVGSVSEIVSEHREQPMYS